jgi:uncharacterized membrane protein
MSMHWIYLLSVWLHLTAMAAWLGGMVFLAAVVLPILRAGPREQLGAFMARAAPRLRAVGWACLILLGVTGWIQLSFRGLAWNANGLILSKIATYATIVLLSLLHDFWVGPRASAAMRDDPDGPQTIRWRLVR